MRLAVWLTAVAWHTPASANNSANLALAELDERAITPQIVAQSAALSDAVSVEFVAGMSAVDSSGQREVKPAIGLPMQWWYGSLSLGLSPALESLDAGVGSSLDHVALSLPLAAGLTLGRWSLDSELGYNVAVDDDEWTLDTQLGCTLTPSWSLLAIAITNATPELGDPKLRVRLGAYFQAHDTLQLIGAIGQGARDAPYFTADDREETLGFVAIRWLL